MGKILGLDYGEKRLGIAIADMELSIATPITTIDVGDVDADDSYLKKLIISEKIEIVVVGHPLGLSGKKTESTLRAEEFARRVNELFRVDVVLWDERLTTKEIEKNLILELRKGGKKKASNLAKERLDALSACLILQNYLDHLEYQK